MSAAADAAVELSDEMDRHRRDRGDGLVGGTIMQRAGVTGRAERETEVVARPGGLGRGRLRRRARPCPATMAVAVVMPRRKQAGAHGHTQKLTLVMAVAGEPVHPPPQAVW